MQYEEFNNFVKKMREIKEQICTKGGPCNNCGLYDLNHPCSLNSLGVSKTQFNFIQNYDVVDWSKIPIDTKVIVWDDDEKNKFHRYFAKYENGKVYTWQSGATSYSGDKNFLYTWEHVQLYKE